MEGLDLSKPRHFPTSDKGTLNYGQPKEGLIWKLGDWRQIFVFFPKSERRKSVAAFGPPGGLDNLGRTARQGSFRASGRLCTILCTTVTAKSR